MTNMREARTLLDLGRLRAREDPQGVWFTLYGEAVTHGMVESECVNQDLTAHLEHALSTLSPKENEVLRLRFGIGARGEHTLEEVGQRFSVTQERVRQIQAKAVQKLRRRRRRLEALMEN